MVHEVRIEISDTGASIRFINFKRNKVWPHPAAPSSEWVLDFSLPLRCHILDRTSVGVNRVK